jgi:aminoglycoside phosphotransferase (APT) family kinase protein
MTDDLDEAARHEQQAVGVRAWLEAELGTVVTMERQARWRPAWFATVKRADGAELPLYVRGAREGLANTSELAEEAAMLRVLEAHGVPCAHVYGMIDEPEAIVMDALPGRANLGTAGSEAEQRAVLDHYIEILTQVHGIDPAAFVAEGLRMPEGAADVALNMFDRFEAMYRRDKQAPAPLLEFGIQWVRRNVLTHRDQPRFVTCDSAQFMFADGRVTGLIDLENGYLGDPMQDLASFRMRDMTEPLGDVIGGMRRYEELTGEPLDVAAIDYHLVQWSLCTPMSLNAMVQGTPPLVELMQYFEWYHQYALTALEALAHVMDAPIPSVELPAPAPTRDSGVYDALRTTIRTLEADDDVARFRRDSTATMAEYLGRVDRYGPAIAASDLDDVEALLGTRPADWAASDAALEAFVLDAGPEHDVALLQLFVRSTLRRLLLMEPILTTGRISRIDPLAELLGRS